MTACLCVCVYIKQPLTAIGGGGGLVGVFALAAIQHSTFLCDIQCCDLRKPSLQRLSLSLFTCVPSLSLQPHSLPLFKPPLLSFPLFPPSLDHFLPPSFHIWTWVIICHLSPSHQFIFPPSFSLNVSAQHSLFFWQRSPEGASFLVLQVKTHISLLSMKFHNTSKLSWSLNVSLRCIFLLY